MTPKSSNTVDCYKKTILNGESGETEHSHTLIEFTYVTDGELSALVNGKEVKASAGDMLIINAGAPHSFTSAKKKCSYTVIDFLPGVICDTELGTHELKYIFPFLSPVASGKVLPSSVVKKSMMVHVTDKAVAEFESDMPGRLIAVRAAILTLFMLVIRNTESIGFSFDSVSDSELLSVMEKAIDYMKNNIANVNEREIAEMCGLSYSYFSRSFKRIIRMSFSEYCNKTRIELSERMLLETDKPVSVIADELGFSSASHFIQTFRKFRNCSPKKYRTSVQGKG